MKILQHIVLVYILFMLCSCSKQEVQDHADHSHNHETEEQDSSNDIVITRQQFDASNYQIGQLKNKDITERLPVTGEIHLPERSKASVSTYLEGKVGDIYLLEGQWVSKGKRLFTISNPTLIDLQASYLISSGELEYLTADYERLIKLEKEQVALKKDVLKAKSLLRSTKASVAAMREKLSLYGIDPDSISDNKLVTSIDINSPINGYVSSIDVVVGQHLQSTTSALTIVNTNHMHLELKVLEKDINKLTNEQPVTFSVQGAPNVIYNADIHLIQKVLDADRMVQVHCHLDEETEKAVTAGMFVTADIHIGTRSGVMINEDGVVQLNGQDYILEVVADNNDGIKLKRQEVIAGEAIDGYREIINSDIIVSNDKSYLIKGAYYVMVDPESDGGHSH